MFIIDVVPLSRGIQKEILSYVSAFPVSVGDCVRIPLRSRDILGFVVTVRTSAEMKGFVKSLPYALKHVYRVIPTTLFSSAFLETLEDIRTYYAVSGGLVFSHMIPRHVQHLVEALSEQSEIKKNTNNHKMETLGDSSIVMHAFQDRVSYFKTITRTLFAQKQSLVIVVASWMHAEKITRELDKGIRDHVYTFHGALTKKQFLKQAFSLLQDPNPSLCIMTAGYLSLVPDNAKTIIVEQEGSPWYRTRAEPSLDMRIAVEFFALRNGMHIIFADHIIRPETYHLLDHGHVHTPLPPTVKLWHGKNTIKIVDLKQAKELPDQKVSAHGLSHTVRNMIRDAVHNSTSLLLLVSRRGLASMVACSDCMTPVACTLCNRPASLYHNAKKQDTENKRKHALFVCYRCKHQFETQDTCGHCGGWRLRLLGDTPHRIAEYIEKNFPGHTPYILEGGQGKTKKDLQNIYNEYVEKKGVLIATEMVFSFLDAPVDASCVVSLDSFIGLPDSTAYDRMIRFVAELTTWTENMLVLQTTYPDHALVQLIQKNSLSEIYGLLLQERKTYGAMPFVMTVRITMPVSMKNITELQNYIEQYLGNLDPDIIHTRKKQQSYLVVLVRLQPDDWTHMHNGSVVRKQHPVLNFLKIAPMGTFVTVNPSMLVS
jgi:primosomal protein N'